MPLDALLIDFEVNEKSKRIAPSLTSAAADSHTDGVERSLGLVIDRLVPRDVFTDVAISAPVGDRSTPSSVTNTPFAAITIPGGCCFHTTAGFHCVLTARFSRLKYAA